MRGHSVSQTHLVLFYSSPVTTAEATATAESAVESKSAVESQSAVESEADTSNRMTTEPADVLLHKSTTLEDVMSYVLNNDKKNYRPVYHVSLCHFANKCS